MIKMNDLLKAEALMHGDRLQIIPVQHLSDLQKELFLFAESHELNGFQKWIVNDLYNYTIPDTNFRVRSIILMALSHPFYADAVFKKSGKEYISKCLVYADSEQADQYLRVFLRRHGYHAELANNLPLKRLGVHSGLSKYGRNNITYIDGMGSNFSLVAYFSDLPCKNDNWKDTAQAQITARECEDCHICLNKCPTGAIRKDRFLIDNQRCLSAINEAPGDFPEWLSDSVHHTCYDCLRCQESCPMNIGHTEKMAERVVFSEQETEMLLQGSPREDFSETTRRNIFTLGLHQWYSAIPRNIKALLSILR